MKNMPLKNKEWENFPHYYLKTQIVKFLLELPELRAVGWIWLKAESRTEVFGGDRAVWNPASSDGHINFAYAKM